MPQQIKLSTKVFESLCHSRESTFLLGWAEGTNIICIGCAVDSVTWTEITDFRESLSRILALFPAGVGVIGIYRDNPVEETSGTSESMLLKLLSSGAEDFVVGPLLAVVHQLTPVIKSYMFDTQTGKVTSTTLTVVSGKTLTLNTLTMRVKGQFPISFEVDKVLASTPLENLEKAFRGQREKLTSQACSFVLDKSSLLLRNSETYPFRHSALNDNSCCGDLAACISADEDVAILGQEKLKKNKINSVMNFNLVIQTTGTVAISKTASCVPLIRYERKNFTSVDVTVGIDLIALVPSSLPLINLPSLLTDGILTQLSAMRNAMIRCYKETSTFRSPKVFHFSPSYSDSIVTVVFPDGRLEPQLELWRRDVHAHLLLPTLCPLVRREMRLRFPDELLVDGRLLDVHLDLPLAEVPGGQLALVRGSYAYYHYMQDHVNDNGWGCAYRSLQTIISWFRNQGYTDAPVPTHTQIQQALVDVGDKPTSFVNSKRWIGSLEVSYCLDQLIGISSKIMFVSSGSELASKGHELLDHFSTKGSPIMIGGGVLAHTILGVYYDAKSGDIKFLVLDPHYTGSDDLLTIQAKGWCGWKGPKFWDKSAFYNLCCPQTPFGI